MSNSLVRILFVTMMAAASGCAPDNNVDETDAVETDAVETDAVEAEAALSEPAYCTPEAIADLNAVNLYVWAEGCTAADAAAACAYEGYPTDTACWLTCRVNPISPFTWVLCP